LDKFLLFVAAECFWRIICGKERKEKIISEGKQRFVKRSGGIVRAHLRRLPICWKASDQAITTAQMTLGVLPPSGFTFVQEHLRGDAELKLISNPLFIYSDEDLGYSQSD
jgi:hypothetical protein